MRCIKCVIAIALFAMAALSGQAWADRDGGHIHFGMVVGSPWPYYPPYYYNYPPPYPPAVVVQSPPPPVYYIEQNGGSAPAARTPAERYWYYCSKPKGYYPYVKACPEGWQKVPPQPPHP